MSSDDATTSGGERRYRCFTKARSIDRIESVERNASWLVARRAWFDVFDDRVECGSWVIPFADVDEAVVHEIRQLFTTAQVLELRLADRTYQFGFNPWADPIEHLTLEHRVEPTQLGWSAFSIALRAAALAAIAVMIISALR